MVRTGVGGLGLRRFEMAGSHSITHGQTCRTSRSVPVRLAILGVGAAALLLGGCSGSSLPSLPKMSELNPFAEPEKILPGKRIPVMPASTANGVGGGDLAPADRAITLASAVANPDWPQPGGAPSNAPGHLAFGGSGRRAWSVSAGTGSSSRTRLSVSPIAFGGRIYVIDAAGALSSFSASGGSRGWRVSLVPEGETAREGYGGGLAVDGGRLIAATGFGRVMALNPATGAKLWETNVRVPVRAAPTAVNGQVYVIGADGRVFALNAEDGSEVWSFRGLPQTTRLIGNPSPAVAGGKVIIPYPSGDLIALNTEDGLLAWSDSLASTRISGLGNMSDVSRPAIAANVVYAAGHSGRLAAINLADGERIWSLNVPGVEAPAISGNMLFVVDTQGQLMGIDAKGGQVVWTVKLPKAASWHGPILASSKLWLTSSEGHLLSADAKTGRVLSQPKVAEKFFMAPIVAGGRLYALSDDGRLMAFN
jgi:outer membrane protein assembly factor BamB